MRRRCRSIVQLMLVGGLLLAATLPARAQDAPPEFDVDVVSVLGGTAGKTRVDLYTRVPLTRLRFVNTPNGFTARYQVSAEIYELDDRNRRGNLVESPIWERTVRVDNYATTLADGRSDPTTHSLQLRPGRYYCVFQIEDQETRATFVRNIAMEVRNLAKPVAVSDVLLLESYDQQKSTINPSVANRVGTDRPFLQVFYEVYAKQPQRVKVTREVIRLPASANPTLVQSILGIGRSQETDEREVVRTTSDVMEVKPKRTQAISTVPLAEIKAGDYLLRVRVETEGGRPLDVVEKAFKVEWTGLAEHLMNLEDAIAQLQYIAKDRDLRHIKEAKNDAERFQRFQSFWEKRDPTPGTYRNERMEEYYYRIDFANRRYGSITDGWRTDRGYVLVLFGEPDYVERHQYDYDVKPYEVWYYQRLGRRFIFVDDSGFGDFKLLVPVWDERTRIR